MGRKKACFGREDYVCLTKDCPYMNECIQAVWEKKLSSMLRRVRKDKDKDQEEKLNETKARR
jgi:hypothetical protein